MTRFETTSQRSDRMSLNDVVGQLLRGGMSPASRTRLEHSTGPNGLGGLDAQGGLGDVLSSFLGGDAAGRSSGGDGGLLGGIGRMLSGSRSEERRGGRECVSTGRYRWSTVL